MERMKSHKVNSGFSLVELVVVIAIMGIIGAGIIGFMVTGLSSYRNVSNEADVANEAQLVMNQLENLIVDCGYGLNYTYTTAEDEGGNVTTGFVETDASMPEDTASKSITVYNLSCRYVITFDGDAQTITYQKDTRNTDDDGNYTTGFTTGTASLMAENVTAFSASIDAKGSAVVVSLALTITEGEKSYSASQNITLRNSLSINEDDESVIYGDTDSAVSNTYTGVVVKGNGQTYTTETTNNTISLLLLSGNTVSMQFSASVSGTGFPSQECSWTLTDASGNDPSLATCANGLLTIPYGETASTLVLSVASKGAASAGVTLDPVKITIYVTTIQSIRITAGSAVDTDSFYNGATVSLAEDAGLYATVTTGTGLYTDYYWVAGDNCSISDSTLTITGSSGDTFTVYAYSQYDTSVYAIYTGTIVDTPTVNTHTGLTLSASASYIWRGGSVYLYATDNSGEYYSTSEVTWAVSNETSTTYFTVTNTTDSSGNPCGLLETTSTMYDYSWSKTLTITATAEDSTGTVTASYSIAIPRVYVQFCVGSSTGTYSGYGYVSMSDINVGSSIDVYYQVTGIVSPGAVSFSWDDSTFSSNNVSINSSSSKITITRTSSDSWSNVTLTATASVGGTALGECALYVVYPSTSSTSSYSDPTQIPCTVTGDWVYMSDGVSMYKVTFEEYYQTNKSNGYWYYLLWYKDSNGCVSYYQCWSEGSTTWYSLASMGYGTVSYNGSTYYIPLLEISDTMTSSDGSFTYTISEDSGNNTSNFWTEGNKLILTITPSSGGAASIYSATCENSDVKKWTASSSSGGSSGGVSGDYDVTNYTGVSNIPYSNTDGWNYLADGETLYQVWTPCWNNGSIYYILAIKNGTSVSYYYGYTWDNSISWKEMSTNTWDTVHYNLTYEGQNIYIPFVVTDGWEEVHFSSFKYKVEYNESTYLYTLTIIDSDGEQLNYSCYIWNSDWT